MRAISKLTALFCGLALGLAMNDRAMARSDEATVQAASDVLDEFLNLRVKEIPASLLSEAHGVVIIPDLIKVGLVLGGQRGKGVVMVREPDGTWRAPMFVTLTGGSIGWQVGAQSSDIVLVFKTPKSVEGLLKGKFTLGADAAVAAGPVGRRASAGTDGELKAEIYSYARSRGLFAGVSIDGSVLEINEGSNAAYYGTPGQPVPESALSLVQAIAKLTANPDAIIAGPAAATGPVPTPADPLGQPTLADPRGRPTSDADAVRGELARAAAALNPLLDQTWRRYLALPAEVHQTGRHPAPETLQACLKRFSTIATSPSYRLLAEREEFQSTHGWLQTYHDTLAPSAGPKLALPPPPGTEQR